MLARATRRLMTTQTATTQRAATAGRRTMSSSSSTSDPFEREYASLVRALESSGAQPGTITPEQFGKLATENKEVASALSKIQGIFNDVSTAEFEAASSQVVTEMKPPVRVAVTGASGAIGYAMLFRIASGAMLGPNQPVILQLLELPQAMGALEGVVMELKDCAFPLVAGIETSDDPNKAFSGTDYAILVGAKPRGKGMERKDLLSANGGIFSVQGKALNDNANRDTLRVLVVGNPANTNALIAAHNAPNIDPTRFTAMTRLDHNRGLAQLADKTGARVQDIERFAIWGNHSATQYPDVSHTRINDKWAKDVINDEKWIRDTFIPTVQQRGAAIINARGASSAASAAGSAIDHIRDWVAGTKGEWTSMGVLSDGSYGSTEGLYFSYPVVCSGGDYSVVQNVPIDEFSASRLEATNKELLEERDAVTKYLKK